MQTPEEHPEPKQPQPNTFPVFSTLFMLKPNMVMEQSNKNKRQMEDLISAFIRRAESQLIYQKNLNECSKIVEKYIQPESQKCLSYISSAFKVDNEQRGNQARQFAQSLKTEIIDPMSELLKKYTNSLRGNQKNFKKLNKDYVNAYENYRKAKNNFEQSWIETEEMSISKNIYKFTSEFSQEKKNRMVGKTMESIRKGMEDLRNYRNAVNQLNDTVTMYQKDMTQMLNEMQLLLREQIRLQNDAIRKLIVCQLSMFRNIEYDLINISKQMQKIYGENDIQIFKEEAKKINNEEDREKDMSVKYVESDRNFLAFSLKNAEGDYYSWELGVKKNKGLRKVMELRMKQLNPTMQKKISVSGESAIKVTEQKVIEQDKKIGQIPQNSDKNDPPPISPPQSQLQQKNPIPIQPQKQIEVEWQNIPKQLWNPPFNHQGNNEKLSVEEDYKIFLQLTELINNIWIKGDEFSQDVKNKFVEYIGRNHFIRILGYMYIEEYRIENQIIICWQNQEKVSEMTRLFIITCQKYGDVFTLKGILSLIFTFYFVENDKMKKQLCQMALVNQCQVWKRQDFWQSAIFQSTYEQMINISAQKSQTPEQTLLRQKNLIFSQLATYCHYMLILTIPSRNVRKIVGRYCRLYNTSDDQNQNLSKMISGTIKQMKDINNNLGNNNNSTGTRSPQNSVSSEGNMD